MAVSLFDVNPGPSHEDDRTDLMQRRIIGGGAPHQQAEALHEAPGARGRKLTGDHPAGSRLAGGHQAWP